MESFYLDEQSSDMFLKFENEEPGNSLTLPVHSFVLKRSSDVFKAMIDQSSFKESHTKVIEIEIMGDVNVGLHFVKYLYTKTLVNVELDSYIIMLKMAHMYNMGCLLRICEERLRTKVDPSSVCRMYQALEAVSSAAFRAHCLTFMLRFAFVIFMESRQSYLNETTMEFLLKSETLNALDEDQILEALWHWGRMRCLQENRPGNKSPESAVFNLLPFIRWSHVKNDNADAPWFKVAREHKVKCARSVCRCARSPEISLNEYAEKLCLKKGYGNALMDFKPEAKLQMLLFATNKDILLSGMSFILYVKNLYTAKDSVKLFLNNVELSDFAFFNESVKNYYQPDQQAQKTFSCHMKVELVKPVHVGKSCINVLHMSVNDRGRVAFPHCLSSSTNLSKPGKSEVSFSIQGRVSSIASLYYFVKK